MFKPYAWWTWPGGAVEDGEIERELRLIAGQGFGGVEIIPYAIGMSRTEIEADPAIATVGTRSFYSRVATACRVARDLGLEVHLMLGSSWPQGGPWIREHPALQLVMAEARIAGGTRIDAELPRPGPPAFSTFLSDAGFGSVLAPFDENLRLVSVVGARVANGSEELDELVTLTDVTTYVQGSRIVWDAPEGEWLLVAVYENRSGQRVNFAAYPGRADEMLALDHLNRGGIGEFLAGVGEPMVEALGPFIGNPLTHVFLDSFELVGNLPWTREFPARFSGEFGYEIAPFLPLLFRKYGEVKYLFFMPDDPIYRSGEIGPRVREDYEALRSRLFLEEFVQPLVDWAHSAGLRLRYQPHGGYGDYIEAYQMADVPETESLFAGGTYEFLKLASSAAHVAGKRRVSSETMSTGLPPRALSLEDFYFLTTKVLAAGTNQIYHYLYPYRYVRADGRRWYPYDTGNKEVPIVATSWSDEDHPAWSSFPALNSFSARLSYALSLGSDRADLAWLYPRGDYPEKIEAYLGRAPLEPGQGESAVSAALREAGFTFDFVNRSGLEKAAVHSGRLVIGAAEYAGLLVTDLEAVTPAMMEALERISSGRAPIVVVGELFGRALGYVEATRRDGEVTAASERLRGTVVRVESAAELGRALAGAGILPAISSDAQHFPFRVVRRALDGGEVQVLFNETGEAHSADLALQSGADSFTVLDPETGQEIEGAVVRGADGRLSALVTVLPRRAVVLLVTED
ncbi:MAG: hypothetical protein HYY13_00415 [Nitrospirae bacterium]|nr:hypothetical protein [Nitrospirota bacterium]